MESSPVKDRRSNHRATPPTLTTLMNLFQKQKYSNILMENVIPIYLTQKIRRTKVRLSCQQMPVKKVHNICVSISRSHC